MEVRKEILMKIQVSLLLILPLILSGCVFSAGPKIIIRDLAVREARVSSPTAEDLNFRCICDTITGDTSSLAYMTIHNNGMEEDRLIRAETDAAVKVEFRQPEEMAGAGGFPLLIDTVAIPVRGEAVFGPGQYQMTLAGLKEDLKPGEKVTLRLFFEREGQIEVEAEITPRE
jgi:copper(I)-binding protein